MKAVTISVVETVKKEIRVSEAKVHFVIEQKVIDGN